MQEKVGKSRNTVFLEWFGAPEGRKVGSLKRRVRSQLARWEMKNCTPLWHEAHFQVKMYKTHHVRTTFGSCDVEKVHAAVARSTFPSQNVQNTRGSFGPLLDVQMLKKCTPLWREAHFEVKMYKTLGVRSDHFWKFRCRKSARGCGAKHISKSKCTKHKGFVRTTFGRSDVEKVHAVVARSTFRSQNVQNTRGSFGPLLEVQMSKKCMLLWREAHFKVKMLKTPGVWTTFGGSDVEKVHAVVARSTFQSQNVQNTRGSFGPLLDVQMLKKCTPLWREAHFEVKMYKTLGVRSDHFWKFRCRKSACRCGAKHISKSKC